MAWRRCHLSSLCILWNAALILSADPGQNGVSRFMCFNKSSTTCDSCQTDLPPVPKTGVVPDTYAFLFTPTNKDNPEFLHECGFKLGKNTTFNASLPTEIFVHGWMEGVCNMAIFREMKDELFKKGCYNVILIDWTWGNQMDYFAALVNLRVAAKQVADLIRNIKVQSKAKKESFHIVGHSLGAQIAGLAGQRVRVGRITGLDPAGQGFPKDAPCGERLDPSDADIVDVMHVNTYDCLPQAYGNNYPTGHVDFYVNGGKIQQSCHITSITSLLKGDQFMGALMMVPYFCDHMEALQYYKVSINPGSCQFVGVKCRNYTSFQDGCCKACGKDGSRCAVMGMDFPTYFQKKRHHSIYQKYYLNTTLMCPYCDNSHLRFEGFSYKPPEQLELSDKPLI